MKISRFPALALTACLAALAMAAFSAFAAEPAAGTATPEESDSYQTVVIGGEVVEIPGADGATYQVGLSTTEYQPQDFATAAGGCASGNHTHKTYYGTVDATRSHFSQVHPCYCTVEYQHTWQCSACNSYGVDTQSVQVWCPSRDTVDSIPGVSDGFEVDFSALADFA